MSKQKRPVNQRPSEYITPEEAFGGGSLSLPEFIEEDLKKQGLGFKWINETLLNTNQGRHPRGWKVYTYDGSSKEVSGLSAEGHLRAGDLILGVKPLVGPGVTIENHKKLLRQRVRQQETSMKERLKPFEDAARSSGMQDYDDE